MRIDSRTTQPHDQPEELPPRAVHFATPSDGALSDFNHKVFTIRRHSQQIIELEVSGSQRLKSQLVDVEIKTSPASDSYCVGPELTLRFRVGKGKMRVWGGSLLGVFGTIAALIGVGIVSTHIASGVALIGFGTIAGVLAYALFTGRIPLPGSS